MKKLIIIIMIMGFGLLFAQNSYLTLNDMPPNQVYTESEIGNVLKADDIKSLEYKNTFFNLIFYRYRKEPNKLKYPQKDKSLYRMLIKYVSVTTGETSFVVTDTKMDWVYQNIMLGVVVGKNPDGNYVINYVGSTLPEKKWMIYELPKEQKFVCGYTDLNRLIYFDGNSKKIYSFDYLTSVHEPLSNEVFKLNNPYIYALPGSSEADPIPCIRNVNAKGVPTSNEYWTIENGLQITKSYDDLADKKKPIVKKQLTWKALVPGQIYDTKEILDLLDTSGDIMQYHIKEFNKFSLYHFSAVKEPVYDFPRYQEKYYRYLITVLGQDGFSGVCFDPVIPSVMVNNQNAVIVAYTENNEKSIFSINMADKIQTWHACPLKENNFADCILVGTDLYFWDKKSKKIKVYNSGRKEIIEINGGDVIKANPYFYDTDEGVFVRQVDANKNPTSKNYYQLAGSGGEYFIVLKND